MDTGLSDNDLMAILNGNQELYSNLTTTQKYLVDQLFSGSGEPGNFKPYQKIDDYRTVDLGININMKDSEREISDINISNVNIPNLNLQTYEFIKPELLDIPEINIEEFNLTVPVPNILNVSTPSLFNLDTRGASNGDITGFFPYGDDAGGNSIISQMDLESGEISVTTAGSVTDPTDPGYYSYTLNNVIGAPAKMFSLDTRYIELTGGTVIEELAELSSGIYNCSTS